MYVHREVDPSTDMARATLNALGGCTGACVTGVGFHVTVCVEKGACSVECEVHRLLHTTHYALRTTNTHIHITYNIYIPSKSNPERERMYVHESIHTVLLLV